MMTSIATVLPLSFPLMDRILHDLVIIQRPWNEEPTLHHLFLQGLRHRPSTCVDHRCTCFVNSMKRRRLLGGCFQRFSVSSVRHMDVFDGM